VKLQHELEQYKVKGESLDSYEESVEGMRKAIYDRGDIELTAL
jgi:hypothetical protein